jgi:gluconolactonase
MRFRWIPWASGCALASLAAAQGIPGVVAPDARAELVQEGFTFTEGPVGTGDGGLYFSDIRNNGGKTFRMDPGGRISLFREQTGGMNGMALMKDGTLAGAEGEGKRISKVAGGAAIALTAGSAGQPLMAPNDLIVDGKGGIYFTDPGPRPVVPGRIAFVYYLPAGAKEPRVVDASIVRPNGITLTNNFKTLIVDDTVGETIFAFDVQADGSVRNKRPFAKMRDVEAGKESGADGLALDQQDRIFVTSSSGVQVFDRSGEYLGTIRVPRQPANVAFAGPGKKTLYITAREGLYRVPTLTAGPKRPGK